MAAYGHIYKLIIKPLDLESCVKICFILILSMESISDGIYAIRCYKRMSRSISRLNNEQLKLNMCLNVIDILVFFQQNILMWVLIA